MIQEVEGSSPFGHPKHGLVGPSGRRNLAVNQNEIISNTVGSNPIIRPKKEAVAQRVEQREETRVSVVRFHSLPQKTKNRVQ